VSISLAQQPAVVGDHVRVAFAEFPEEARRALHIGEQEGDGACRESHRSNHHLYRVGVPLIEIEGLQAAEDVDAESVHTGGELVA
jgi:hypothetical protein